MSSKPAQSKPTQSKAKPTAKSLRPTSARGPAKRRADGEHERPLSARAKLHAKIGCSPGNDVSSAESSPPKKMPTSPEPLSASHTQSFVAQEEPAPPAMQDSPGAPPAPSHKADVLQQPPAAAAAQSVLGPDVESAAMATDEDGRSSSLPVAELIPPTDAAAAAAAALRDAAALFDEADAADAPFGA